MDKVLQRLRKNVGQFLPEDRSSKTAIIIGTIIGVFISCSPYFFYLYESVPALPRWRTKLFVYDSRYWEDAKSAMWVLTGKLMPLIFLIVWFFTNKHWWYHSLLVPISMYTYQIAQFFNDDSKIFDEFQLLYMVPIMAVIIPSIYLIRARMFSQLNDADKTFEELEQEFMMKPTNFWDRIRQYF